MSWFIGKKVQKIISTSILVILFLIILFFSNRLLWYLLVDDTSSYTRITLHELYNQEDNIDVLFLGSSHCYRSLDPAITDEVFGTNTFNAGSSGQALDGSYALLVETGKKYNLKKVYVELYFSIVGRNFIDRDQMTHVYIISDYMKPSLNRFSYLTNASSSAHWINGFFPARRNWDKLFKSSYVSRLIRKKNTDSYKNYEYIEHLDTSGEYYAGKGFVGCTEMIENGNFSVEGSLGSANRVFSEDDIKYIKKIIEFCKNNDIELTFFSAPMSDFKLAGTGDYDSYIQYVRDFMSDYNIPYYDFNLCKEEYFSYDSNFFIDVGHMNTLGAEAFSKIFSDFFTGKILEKDLFYSSYKEKLASIEDHFYGLIYQLENTENEKVIHFTAVQNRNFNYFASVFKRTSELDEYQEIQDLGGLETVKVPIDEQGQLLIFIFSDKDGNQLTNQIIIDY